MLLTNKDFYELAELFGYDLEDDTQYHTYQELAEEATDAIHTLTLRRYQGTIVTKIPPLHRRQLSEATAALLKHRLATGNQSFAETNQTAGSVTIGRTRIDGGSNNNASGYVKKTNKAIPDEVYLALSGSGLLYRGVGSL